MCNSLSLLMPRNPYNYNKGIIRRKKSIWDVTMMIVVGPVAAFVGGLFGGEMHSMLILQFLDKRGPTSWRQEVVVWRWVIFSNTLSGRYKE